MSVYSKFTAKNVLVNYKLYNICVMKESLLAVLLCCDKLLVSSVICLAVVDTHTQKLVMQSKQQTGNTGKH